MTVTLTLPEELEEALTVEARTRGLSLDELIRDKLISEALSSGSREDWGKRFELEYEDGVPVLRTGKPIAVEAVDDTLASIRSRRF